MNDSSVGTRFTVTGGRITKDSHPIREYEFDVKMGSGDNTDYVQYLYRDLAGVWFRGKESYVNSGLAIRTDNTAPVTEQRGISHDTPKSLVHTVDAM